MRESCTDLPFENIRALRALVGTGGKAGLSWEIFQDHADPGLASP